MLFAFVLLDLVSSLGLQSQEIGYEEHLQNGPFCVEWDVETLINQSHCQVSPANLYVLPTLTNIIHARCHIKERFCVTSMRVDSLSSESSFASGGQMALVSASWFSAS